MSQSQHDIPIIIQPNGIEGIIHEPNNIHANEIKSYIHAIASARNHRSLLAIDNIVPTSSKSVQETVLNY